MHDSNIAGEVALDRTFTRSLRRIKVRFDNPARLTPHSNFSPRHGSPTIHGALTYEHRHCITTANVHHAAMTPRNADRYVFDDEPDTRVRPAPPLPAIRAIDTAPPIRVVACPRTDLEVLDAALSAPERLTLREQQSFGSMRRSMIARSLLALSYAQRSWAQEVAARLGFDVDAPTGWRGTQDQIRAIPRTSRR